MFFLGAGFMLAATFPTVIMIHPSVPAQNAQEFVALAKAKPGTVSYGSSGEGSAVHLAMETFSTQAGIKMIHVPYNAPGTATTNLIAGDIQLMFQLIPGIAGQVKSGKVRALAVMAPQRSPALPDVPTIAEAGSPGDCRAVGDQKPAVRGTAEAQSSFRTGFRKAYPAINLVFTPLG